MSTIEETDVTTTTTTLSTGVGHTNNKHDNNKPKPYIPGNPASMVEYFYYHGWNKCKVNVMKEIIEEQHFKFRGGLCHKTRGMKTFLEYMYATHAALQCLTCQVLDIIVCSDNKKAAAKLKISGIHKSTFFGVEGTNMEVTYAGSAFFTFNDTCTKIIELWTVLDVNSLKNQIGATSSSEFQLYDSITTTNT